MAYVDYKRNDDMLITWQFRPLEGTKLKCFWLQQGQLVNACVDWHIGAMLFILNNASLGLRPNS